MATTEQLLQQLLQTEAIKQLKYRYFRLLDMKQFDALAELMTEDVTTSYDNGRNAFENRDQAIAFFSENMAKTLYHQHHGHHPEITFQDENNASGIWHFEDTVFATEVSVVIRGAGIYYDEYVKQDGEWKIAHTGYERLWCTTEPYHEAEWREVRGFFDPEERALSAARTKRPGEEALFGSLVTPKT